MIRSSKSTVLTTLLFLLSFLYKIMAADVSSKILLAPEDLHHRNDLQRVKRNFEELSVHWMQYLGFIITYTFPVVSRPF